MHDISRRRFLQYAASAAVVGGAAVGASSYYRYSYLPSLTTKINVPITNTVAPEIAAVNVIGQQKLGQKYGLDIEWSFYSEVAAMLSSFIAGKGTPPFAEGFSVLNLIEPTQQGLPLKIIGATSAPTDKILVRKGSGIKSVKDLEGRSVAAFSATPILLWTLGKTYGIDIKSLKVLISPPPVIASSLVSGKLDVAELTEPYASQAVLSGQVDVLTSFAEQWQRLSIPPLPIVNAGIAWEDSLKKFGDVAIKLNNTLYEAFSFIRRNPSLVQDVFVSALKLPPNVAELAAKETVQAIPTFEWNEKLIGQINGYLQDLVDVGVLRSAPANLLTAAYTSSSVPGIQ